MLVFGGNEKLGSAALDKHHKKIPTIESKVEVSPFSAVLTKASEFLAELLNG